MNIGKTARYTAAALLAAAVLVSVVSAPVSAGPDHDMDPTKNFVTQEDMDWDGDTKISSGEEGLQFPEDNYCVVFEGCFVFHGSAGNDDDQDGDIPPVKSEKPDRPDVADSVDDRLEEFKNLDSDGFESPSGEPDIPDDATKDFDTTPGSGLDEDLDKRIGPNPTDGFDQRLENRPSDEVKENSERQVGVDGRGETQNNHDSRDGDLPPVEEENTDEPDAADSVDDRLEEFKDPDSEDFKSPSDDLDLPDDATKDFDTTPGPSLGEDLDKKIGPNPSDGYRHRFKNRPGDDVERERNAGSDRKGASGDYPQKDFKTGEDEMEWETEIGPNPTDGYDQRFDNRPGDDAEKDASDQGEQGNADDENLPQKDFKTGKEEPDWDTEIGPNPSEGFRHRFKNRPTDDIEEKRNGRSGPGRDGSYPRKDFRTRDDEPDWDTEIGPNPSEGFRHRFKNRPTRSR